MRLCSSRRCSVSGAGSLSQQSWEIPLSLLPKLGAIALLSALLMRPLSLLDLGEGGASSHGVSVAQLRFIAVAAAVALAAFVTSAVGVIGFIGLVAPTLARLAVAHRPRELLLWSSLIGAALPWLADGAVQYFAGAFSDFLPTGAVTAIFDLPPLLLLLPRLKIRHRGVEAPRQRAKRRGLDRRLALPVLLGLLLALAVSLLLGPGSRWRLGLARSARGR